MTCTSASSTPNRGRGLALGAVAVVTVGLFSAYASVIDAQPASDPILIAAISVDATGSWQVLPDDVVPAISDTGGVVAYETLTPPSAATADDGTGDAEVERTRVWIRDRAGDTSRPVAEFGSAAPGISGNGCLVAYTVIGVSDVSLTVVDRCATEASSPLPIGTVLDTVASDTLAVDAVRVAAPALSFDGSTIVWSTGNDVRRYARPAAGGPHVRSHIIDIAPEVGADVIPEAGADVIPEVVTVTGAAVDVSADGRTVVFLAGPGATPFEPTPANVYVWTVATPQLEPELLSAASSSPTISGDGSFVVFESSSIELSVVGSSSVTTPFVVGVDLVTRSGQILVDDASRPAVSADGNHVVYQRGAAVRVLSSDATTTVDHGIDELAVARPTGAVAISQFGRWIVLGSAVDLAGSAPDSQTVTPTVWAVDRKSSSVDVVDTTTAPTQPTTPTTQPTTPTTQPTTPTTQPTTPTTQPTTPTTQPTTPTTQPTTPTTPTTAPATTSSSTPTATVPEVVSSSTVPATTLVPTVTVPRFPTTTDRFPSVGFPQTPRPFVRSTSVNRGAGTSLDSGTSPDITAFAAPVNFEPTVVEAGRRTQLVTLTNASARSVQIAAVSIDVPDVFTIVVESCSGVSLAPASSCSVEVQFAPITVGPAAGAATFRLGDGTVVTASLTGQGVSEPTLDLVPTVAGAGQTVTVFGGGFPPGSTVEFLLPGSSTPEPFVVDPDGTFAHVVVVLPHTPTGPATLEVFGQPDVFDDVTAELLVSSRGATSADAALRGGLSGLLSR